MNSREINIIWRNRLKEQLSDISSMEFQRKAWLENNSNIRWHWDDLIGDYFDGLLLNEDPLIKFPDEGIDFHCKSKSLSSNEADILKVFNEKLDKYGKKFPPYPTKEQYLQILSDPEWIKITEMAKDILQKIDFDKLP